MSFPLTPEGALEIAKKEAIKRGYKWIEPVAITERPESFLVTTNAEELGGNVIVVVDRASGDVKSVTAHGR